MRHLGIVFAGLLLFALVAAVAPAQDPLAILPKNYRLVFENASVRVEHVSYEPHAKLPVHNHPDSPTVYVYLADSGPVRFTHIETKAFTSTRPAVTAGTFRISPGRLEKHEVENPNDIPSEFLRVELKRVPLGFQPGPFRGPKTFDLKRRGVTTEFTSPQFQVRRIIATGPRTTKLQAITPGLLVALSPASITTGKTQTLKVGGVLWVDAHVPPEIGSGGEGAAANVLFIALREE